MPIKRERAEKFYNMVAENRQVKQLLGKKQDYEHISELLTGLDNYLVSPSDQRKGVQPDEATRNLRSAITDMRIMLGALQSNKTEAEGKDGFTAEDEATFRTSMEAVFSRNPSPEQALENYIIAHGEKQLASKEIQLAASLISAFRGMNSIMEHEKTAKKMAATEPVYELINFDRAYLRTEREAKQDEAIEKELDLSDLEQREKDLKAEAKAIEEEKKQLSADYERAKKDAKMKLPAASLYEAAKEELESLKASLALKEKNSQAAIDNAINAEEYEKKNMSKALEAYEEANRKYSAAKNKAQEMAKQYEAHKDERRARIDEINDIEEEMPDDSITATKYVELIDTERKRTALARSADILQKYLNDPDICSELKGLTEGAGGKSLYEKIKGKNKETLLEKGSILEKYLLAKEEFLAGLSENPEELERTKVAFEYIEDFGFSGALFQKRRDNMLDADCRKAMKTLEDKCAELRNDEGIARLEGLEKEKKELEDLDDSERMELHKANEEEKKCRLECLAAGASHASMVEKLCSAAGIHGGKEVSEYKKPENWKKLHDALEEEMDKKVNGIEALKKKVKAAEQTVEKQKAELEKEFSERQKPSDEEKRLGKKLEKLAKKEAAHEIKAQKLNDARELAGEMSNKIRTAFEKEYGFMQTMEANLRGESYAQRISAQLEKLKTSLAAPKRKNDSEEYTRLKNALAEAQTIFSGKAENWNNMRVENQQALEQAALNGLKAAAAHYLSEKEKEPHIWPFASATGFKRRAAANDILSFCESAGEMVANANPLERTYAKLIAAHKNPDGTWKENLSAEVTEHMMANMRTQVKNGIERKQQQAQREAGAPEKKAGGKALGGR